MCRHHGSDRGSLSRRPFSWLRVVLHSLGFRNSPADVSLGRAGPAWSMRLPLLWLSTRASTATFFKARWSSLVVEGQQQHGHGQLERTPTVPMAAPVQVTAAMQQQQYDDARRLQEEENILRRAREIEAARQEPVLSNQRMQELKEQDFRRQRAQQVPTSLAPRPPVAP